MRRRNPYPALLLAALIPALLLAWTWRWSADKGRVVAPTTTTSTVPPVPGTLATPLLSTRRAPAVLSAKLNVSSFTKALSPLVGRIPAGSCLAVSVNGLPIAAANADDSLRPASNVKLAVGAVALAVLGKDFRYTTSVKGTVSDGGVINGDLYLVGSGDPVLSEPWWKDSNITKLPPTVITDITQLADKIAAAGITRIRGRVSGDGTRYDDEWFAPTIPRQVKAELEALPVSALVVNDTRVSETKALADPNAAAAQVLTTLLKDRGIRISGGGLAGTTAAGATEIASIQSAPFSEILHEMLSTSDNLSAEMILKEIAVAKGRPGTRQNGIAVVNETLQGWGLPLDGVTLVDGSGLSDENRMTCNVLLGVLQRGRYSDAVGAGLAVAGQQGTTLEGVFEDSPVKGRLRAKTGTLTNADGVANKPGAKTLAGYLPLAGGGQIEFAMLLNGETITNQSEYRQYWNQLATIIAKYPTGPTVAELAPGAG